MFIFQRLGGIPVEKVVRFAMRLMTTNAENALVEDIPYGFTRLLSTSS